MNVKARNDINYDSSDSENGEIKGEKYKEIMKNKDPLNQIDHLALTVPKMSDLNNNQHLISLDDNLK